MVKKKHKEHGSEEQDEMKKGDEVQKDVIATIHVLKNKEQVKKRVVTRDGKNN